MPMASKIIAASLLACRGLAVSWYGHNIHSHHGHKITSYHPGEFVESFDAAIGQWKTSVYMAGDQPTKSHTVALWDNGVVPNVPDDRVRRFKPFRKNEAVQVLDMKSNAWVLGTALANGTEANTYDVQLQDGGLLTAPHLIMQRIPQLKRGDRVRYFLGGKQFWRVGSIDGVVGEEAPLYNLTVEGAGGRHLVHPSLVRPFEEFAAGDAVRTYDANRSQWIEGGVVQGGLDDTYRVSFNSKVTKNIPGDFLLMSRAKKPDTIYGSTVESGEVLEFLDETMTWAPCRTSGPGKEPFSYTCVAPMTGAMENVSVMLLRKAPRFRESDTAEVLDKSSGIWQRVQVTGQGSLPDTYNVQVPFERVINDLPAVQIRRAAPPAAGEQMEVMQKKTGRATACRVVGPGEYPGTFYVAIQDYPQQVLVSELNLRRRSMRKVAAGGP